MAKMDLFVFQINRQDPPLEECNQGQVIFPFPRENACNPWVIGKINFDLGLLRPRLILGIVQVNVCIDPDFCQRRNRVSLAIAASNQRTYVLECQFSCSNSSLLLSSPSIARHFLFLSRVSTFWTAKSHYFQLFPGLLVLDEKT